MRDVPDLVRATVDKVRREYPGAKLQPATVIQFTRVSGAATATVRFDGDPPESSIEVTSILTADCSPGDRVMVMFDPPQGAYIIGVLAFNQPEGGGCCCFHLIGFTGSGFPPLTGSGYLYVSGPDVVLDTITIAQSTVGLDDVTFRLYDGTVDPIVTTSGVSEEVFDVGPIPLAPGVAIFFEIESAADGAGTIRLDGVGLCGYQGVVVAGGG